MLDSVLIFFMCAVSLKVWYEKYIKVFLKTWNQLRVSLATNGKWLGLNKEPFIYFNDLSKTVVWLEFEIVFHLGEIKIPAEYCQKDLDLNSDLKVLLPKRQGLGLCSTALVSYLIALHNDLVYCMDKHTGEETRWGR